MKNSALNSPPPHHLIHPQLPHPPIILIRIHTHKPLGPELQSAPAPAAVFLHHLVHSINAKRDPHRGHGVLQSARRDRDGEPTLGAAAGSEDAHEAVAVGVGEEVVVGVVRDFGGCRFRGRGLLGAGGGFSGTGWGFLGCGGLLFGWGHGVEGLGERREWSVGEAR